VLRTVGSCALFENQHVAKTQHRCSGHSSVLISARGFGYSCCDPGDYDLAFHWTNDLFIFRMKGCID